MGAVRVLGTGLARQAPRACLLAFLGGWYGKTPGNCQGFDPFGFAYGAPVNATAPVTDATSSAKSCAHP